MILSTLRKALFPLLAFSIFPVINLYITNRGIVQIAEVIPPLLLIIFSAIVLACVSVVIVNSPPPAVILTWIGLAVFSSFYHLHRTTHLFLEAIFKHNPAGAYLISRDGYLVFFLLLSVGFFLFGGWILRHPKAQAPILTFINLMSAVLLISLSITIIQKRVVFDLIGKENASPFEQAWELEKQRLVPPIGGITDRPDVYYLILDGYGGERVLQEYYGISNQDFYNDLEQIGFVINSNATANYKQTNLSISSSLNMIYHQEVVTILGLDNHGIFPTNTMTADSIVFQTFHDRGYRTITLASGYDMTELNRFGEKLAPTGDLSPFSNLFISTTPLSILFWNQPFDRHRMRIEYTLQMLPEIAKDPAPTFTTAHILSPHPPFVWRADGTPVTPRSQYSLADGDDFMRTGNTLEYREGYRGQVTYLNHLLIRSIREIIQNSSSPPILIIQGDHGPGMLLDTHDMTKTDLQERFSIFNAWMMEGFENTEYYSGITPVNTFRVVFNEVFKTNYPILPDRNYYSDYTTPYIFTDITNQLMGK